MVMLVLDVMDTKILSLLRQRRMHSSEMSRELGMPRTSIGYRLKRLASFKRVESKISGRKNLWQLTRARVHSKELFKIFTGSDFYECYKLLTTLPKDSVIYAAQGSEAGKGELRNIPHYFIEDMHRTLKRRNIRMHAIANKKLLEAFAGLQETLHTSHIGRPQGVKLVDRLFVSEGECFITKHFALFSNPTKKRAIIIKDSGVTVLLFDLMSLFFMLSDQIQTFDLNAYLSKMRIKD